MNMERIPPYGMFSCVKFFTDKFTYFPAKQVNNTE